MHIGLLQAGHLPEKMQEQVGDYDRLYTRLLEGEGLELTSWAVVDMVFPKSVHDAEGWLISGSRHGAYEDLPWIPRLEAFVRQIRDAGVPLVGICFGHQIVAQALGGRVEKYKGGWGVGHHQYDWSGDIKTLNAWHQDQVTVPPAQADTIATSAFCEHAALSYGDWALTIQAHPEFGEDETRILLTTRAPGLVPEDRIADALADLSTPIDDRCIAKKIGTFFKESRHG